MTTLLGIDEAGRGCVLGPMVFGAFLTTVGGEEELRALGVRDSKKLSKKKRAALAERFVAAAAEGAEAANFGKHTTLSISPAELDARSLGEIGKEAIVRLALEFRPDVLILDAPVPPRGLPRYRSEMLERLAAAGLDIRGLQLIAENGADDRYPCCAAASILAKTTRDAALLSIEVEAGRPIGSGYPSDPKTIAFLRETWAARGAWPPSVRTKWETARRIVAQTTQARLF